MPMQDNATSQSNSATNLEQEMLKRRQTKFLEELQALQEKYKLVLKPTVMYHPTGIFPDVVLLDKDELDKQIKLSQAQQTPVN